MPAPNHGTPGAYSDRGTMLRLLAILCISLIGCGTPLPVPLTSSHTRDEFVDVPFPPPAVRADVVPPRLHPESLWMDGEWRWQGTRWAWRRGSWVIPPAGATLAPWETVRVGAQVRHAESVFHLADGSSLAPSELRERRRRPARDASCATPAPASFGQRAVWPTAKAP